MITITLPWPSNQLSPNSRTHWAKKAELKKQERDEACVIAYANGVGLSKTQNKIELEIVFQPPDKRPRDLDNMLASIKAQLDGVADALHVNDKCFEPITLRRGAVVKGGAVIVKIGE